MHACNEELVQWIISHLILTIRRELLNGTLSPQAEAAMYFILEANLKDFFDRYMRNKPSPFTTFTYHLCSITIIFGLLAVESSPARVLNFPSQLIQNKKATHNIVISDVS